MDFGYRQILVRDGKGGKDRVTMLPAAVIEPLHAHLARMKAWHERDLADGCGDVELPDAIARKYPRAPYEWGWKFVFPSHKRSVDPRTGAIRRHHVYENYLIRAVKRAAWSAIYTHVLNKGGRGVQSPLDSGGAGQPSVARDIAAEYGVQIDRPPGPLAAFSA